MSNQKFDKNKTYIIGTITGRSEVNNPKFRWSRTFSGKRLLDLRIKTVADLAANDKTEPFDPSQTYYIYEIKNGVNIYFGQFSPEIPKIKQYIHTQNGMNDNTLAHTEQVDHKPEMFYNHSLNTHKENTKAFDRMCGLLEKQVESLEKQLSNAERSKQEEVERIIRQKDDEIERFTQTMDNQITFLEKEIADRDLIINKLRIDLGAKTNELYEEKQKFNEYKTLIKAQEFVTNKEREFEHDTNKKIAQIRQENSKPGLSGIVEELPMLVSAAKEIKAIFSDSGTSTGKIEMTGVSGISTKPRAVVGEPPPVNRMQPPQQIEVTQ